MDVVLDGISPPRFEAASGCFPAMDIWDKVTDFSYREGAAIEQYTFCTAAILDFKMAATKNYI